MARLKASFLATTRCGLNVEYFYDINPKRDYKMSALSFDISILDDCKMKAGKITDNKSKTIR